MNIGSLLHRLRTNSKFLSLLVLGCLIGATSCQWQRAVSADQRPHSVAIPFALGDHDGTFTTDLISQIEKGGTFKFTQGIAEYTLHVRFLDEKYENIGFRHDLKKEHHGKRKEDKRKIIPNESRSKLLAEVTLIENATQKTLLGPAYILATNEYDHQNYTINNDISTFSLGQLSDVDTAEGVINVPLYRNLAREIADYVQNHSITK